MASAGGGLAGLASVGADPMHFPLIVYPLALGLSSVCTEKPL